MANFDIAIGIDHKTMGQGSSIVYGKLYPKLFVGNQDITLKGIKFNVKWNVKSAPTFTLSAPANTESLMSSFLLESGSELPIENQSQINAILASKAGSIFQMNMADVEMTVSSSAKSGTDKVDVTIIVEATSAGGKMTLDPIKATGKTDNPSDQSLINAVILPQAMKMAKTILSGIDLPPLSFGSVELTAPAMIVSANHIIAMANLRGKPVPAAPFPDTWPSTPFFALLSSEAKMKMVSESTSYIEKNPIKTSKSISLGIGTVYYEAKMRMSALRVRDAGATTIAFSSAGSGNVNAGIKILFKIGINYDLYPAPDISGEISLSIENGTDIVARTTRIKNFVLILKPQGNPVEWVLSAITDPILQSVTAIFSPQLTSLFNGYSYNTGPLPSFKIHIEDVLLTANPSSVTLVSYKGMMCAQGNIVFS